MYFFVLFFFFAVRVIRKFKIRRVALLASAGPIVRARVREGRADTPQSEGEQVNNHTNTVLSATQEDTSVPREQVGRLSPPQDRPTPHSMWCLGRDGHTVGCVSIPWLPGVLTCV